MFKRISVHQLQIGMYIEEFCSSWLDHPFWRSGFVITDIRDIERIQASSVTEVWIDCAKGIDIAPGRKSVSEEEANARIDAELDQVAKEERTDNPAPDGQEYASAVAIGRQARQLVMSVFSDARMGKAIDTAGARQLVERVLASVTRNPCALTSLLRLKTMSEFTYLHSVSVCALMVTLARRLELDREQACAAGLAGLLHDIGKAAMPLDVLHKPGKLSEEEYSVIKRHPEEGSRMLERSGLDGEVLDVCLNHHARLDGSGYPRTVRGNEISLFSRMAAVCDVYDAISSDRPYKTAWNPAECIRRMAEWSNGHFDPVVFHAFVKNIGIYPVGSLVRLTSGRLGVVVAQSAASLLTPHVKVFFSTRTAARIPPVLVNLSDRRCGETIEGREDPAKWNFPDLLRLWSGLPDKPW
jgi:putative nucleotidyltransferase with HDIG domain